MKIKKEHNKKLKREWEEKKQKEKNRQLQEVLAEMDRVNKVNSDLERLIANSRNNTPHSTPKRKMKQKSAVKITHKNSSTLDSTTKNRRVSKGGAVKKVSEERSEYQNILSSFLNLKQGKPEAYSELIEQAMEAIDNILRFKNNKSKNFTSKVGHPGKKCTTQTKESKKLNSNKALKLLEALQSIIVKGETIEGNVIDGSITFNRK